MFVAGACPPPEGPGVEPTIGVGASVDPGAGVLAIGGVARALGPRVGVGDGDERGVGEAEADGNGVGEGSVVGVVIGAAGPTEMTDTSLDISFAT